MSPLAQAIVALLEKLAEEELPIIASWIEGRLAPGTGTAPSAPAADPGATQPAPAQPIEPEPTLSPRESPTKP